MAFPRSVLRQARGEFWPSRMIVTRFVWITCDTLWAAAESPWSSAQKLPESDEDCLGTLHP